MAKRSYEQKVLEQVQKRLQSSDTPILARRWVRIVLWILLVLFLTLVIRAFRYGYLPPIAAGIIVLFLGSVYGVVQFYSIAEKQWPFLSPHFDRESIEDRLNTIKRDAKAR